MGLRLADDKLKSGRVYVQVNRRSYRGNRTHVAAPACKRA